MPLGIVSKAYRVAIWFWNGRVWEYQYACALACAARICKRGHWLAAFDIQDDPNALSWSCAR